LFCGKTRFPEHACAHRSTCYASTVYSTQELALQQVTEAIDELDAMLRSTNSADLEVQVAAVWELVGEMNPELAKLASRYASPE
jgi:hypothetical protein